MTWDCVDLDRAELTVAWQLRSIAGHHGCGVGKGSTWPCGHRSAQHCPKGRVVFPDGLIVRHLTGPYYLTPPKSGHARTVPMLDPLIAALIRHRDETADQPNPHGLVWHNDGAPIRPGDDQAEWRAILATVGLPPEVTTHWARHAVSTLLMEAGVDAKVVGEIIGHSDVALTRGTYQHVSTDLARQGMAKLGTLLALDA